LRKVVVIALGAVAALLSAAAPAGAIAAHSISPRNPASTPSTSAGLTFTAEHRSHARLDHSQAEVGSPLVGVFAISAGICSSGSPTGSYFRMIEPGGTLNGPFLSNGNSSCSDKTYTSLFPGTDRGLSTSAYQPNPAPAFDANGNGLANLITQPQEFFGIKFALSTNSTDPQTGLGVAVPSISNSSGTLSGDLEAISVAWNKQNFNQGSPKPGGSTPGLTSVPTGTYNATSGAFTISWASAIVGGPFNNFTGLWHLEGTFISSSSTPPTTTTTSPTSSSTTLPTGSQTGTSTTSASSGSTTGTGTPNDPSGTSRTLASTGLPDDSRYLVLVGIAFVVCGIGLLLVQRPNRRTRSRKMTR